METFKCESTGYGFNYYYERKLNKDESVIVKMPRVSPNKRGINDIGWQTDGSAVTIYGTIANNPEKSANVIWQEIEPLDEINKTVTALKIVNAGSTCTVLVRAILN